MPLIPIPFAVGLNTKIDPKKMPTGGATDIRNFEQKKTGELSRRSATEALPVDVAGDHDDNGRRKVISGHHLHSGGRAAVMLGETRAVDGDALPGGGSRALAFASGPRQWVDQGSFSPSRVGIERVSAGTTEKNTPGGAATKNFLIASSLEASGNATVAVKGRKDRVFSLVDNRLLDTNNTNSTDGGAIVIATPKDKALVIGGTSGVNHVVDMLDSSYSLGTPLTSSTNIMAGAYSEMLNGPIVAYKNSSSGHLTVQRYDNDCAEVSSITIAETCFGPISVSELFKRDGGKQLLITWMPVGLATIRAAFVSSSFTAGTAFNIGSPSVALHNITAATTPALFDMDSSDNGTFQLFTEDTDGSGDRIVGVETIGWDGTALSSTRLTGQGGISLASNAFTHRGQAFVAMSWDSDESQSQYVLASPGTASSEISTDANMSISSWHVHARWLLGRAVSPHSSTGYGLPTVSKPEPGKFSFAALQVDRTLSDGVTLKSVVMVEIDLDPPPSESIIFNGQLVGGGGVLWEWDGRRIVEAGHLAAPEITSGAGASGSGGLSDGTYSFKAIHTWHDALGNIHRSAPSAVYQHTLSAGTSTQQVNLTIREPRLTLKDDEMGSSSIIDYSPLVSTDVYRTVNGGTVYYKRASAGESDANIVNNEILYTQGGVLANDAPPPGHIIAADSERVYIVSSEHVGRVYYSKITAPGDGLSFNLSLYKQISPGGEITAMAVLDGWKVVFGSLGIAAFSGSGPSNTGQGGFSPPRIVSSDIGALADSPTVTTDMGVFFVSDRGIYLLDRSLQAQYVGAPVEGIMAGARVLSADLVAKKQQVRFSLDNGLVLVFDYFHQFWSVFDGFTGLVDAAVVGGVWHWLRGDGTLFAETTEPFQGDTVWESGWVSVASLGGKQKATELVLTGEKGSDSTLKLEVFNDFDDTNHVQVETYDTTPATRLHKRWRLAAPDCTAVKFRITDTPKGGDYSGSKITELGLEVTPRPGVARLSTED